jgi:hypothetical protein
LFLHRNGFSLLKEPQVPQGDAIMYPIEDDFDDIQCEDFYGDDYEAVETDS